MGGNRINEFDFIKKYQPLLDSIVHYNFNPGFSPINYTMYDDAIDYDLEYAGTLIRFLPDGFDNFDINEFIADFSSLNNTIVKYECYWLAGLAYGILASSLKDSFENNQKRRTRNEYYQKSIEYYTVALKKDENSYSYNNRGIAKALLHEYESAIEDFNLAIKLDPNNLLIYYNNRGAVNYRKEKYNSAISDYSKAIKTNSNNVNASIVYTNRGIAYVEKKEFDKAIRDYSKSIEIFNEREWFYICRGMAYTEKGEYDKAIEDYEVALKKYDKRVWTNVCMGNAYFLIGEEENAIFYYDKAIENAKELYPKNYWPYTNRGLYLLKNNKYDKAITDFTKAIELTSNPMRKNWAYLNRGEAFSKKGMHPEALKDFNEAILINPKDISAHIAISKTLYYLNKKEESENRLFSVYYNYELEIDEYIDLMNTFSLVNNYTIADEIFNKVTNKYKNINNIQGKDKDYLINLNHTYNQIKRIQNEKNREKVNEIKEKMDNLAQELRIIKSQNEMLQKKADIIDQKLDKLKENIFSFKDDLIEIKASTSSINMKVDKIYSKATQLTSTLKKTDPIKFDKKKIELKRLLET